MDLREVSAEELSRHGALLGRLARGLVADVHAADDAVQNTYLTALERPPETARSLRAWLVRVLHSRVADGRRTRVRQREQELTREPEEQADIVERLDLAEDVIAAVRSLRESYRTVVYLRYFDDLPPREIAKRLGVPVKTVKTRLARALEELRRELKRETGLDSRGLALALVRFAREGRLGAGVLSAGGIGGIAMAKTLVAAAAVLVVLVGLWQVSRSFERRTRGAPDATEAAVAIDTTDVPLDRAPLRPVVDVGEDERAAASPVVETPGATSTEGELLVHVVWHDDTPAAGVHVVFDPADDPRHGLGTQRLVTDETGSALATLASGKVTLRSDRGTVMSATVKAGELTEVVFRQNEGVPVVGRVLDPDGRSVAGAEIWIAHWGVDWLAGCVVTRTGADGRFSVRDVNASDSLAAFAPSCGPSELVDLDTLDLARKPVEIELVLSRSGGDLVGRVLDPRGEPVSGALVAVGDAPEYPATRFDGSDMESMTARVAVTSEDGTFELRGLPSGLQPVAVLAEGAPQWKGEVEIVAQGEARLDVTLEPGVRVHGFVRDGSGRAVEGAIVLALDEPFVDPFPDQGPTDRGRPFPRPGVHTDATGHFDLPPLPPGDVHLYAGKGLSFWSSERSPTFVGTCQTTLSGGAGEELEWQAVLSKGATIFGRVTFADGAPMPDVFVSAKAEESGVRSTTTTSRDGRFEIPGLVETAHTVSVQLWNPPEGARPLIRRGVWPDAGEVELVADFSESSHENGHARVRIRDDAGRVDGTPSVVMQSGPGSWLSTDRSEWVFDAELPPGRYRPVLLSGDTTVAVGEWFELGPGEDLDLGALVTEPAGGLVLRVVRPEGAGEKLRVQVRQKDFPAIQHVVLERGQDAVELADLTVGTAEISVSGANVATEERVVMIASGVSSDLEIALRPAVRRVFEVALAEAGWQRLDLVVRDPQGNVLHDAFRLERWAIDLPARFTASLPVGRYTIDVSTTDGRSARSELTVDSLAPAESVLLEVR